MKNFSFFSGALPALAALLLPGLLWAQSAAPNDLKLKPVEIEYHTIGGLQYAVDGRLLIRYQDFEELISPVRDYELTRLLKRSESSDLNSKIFGVAGFVGLATGMVGLLSSPSSQQTPFWLTAIGGGVLVDVGGLFQSEAQTAKFNCVQRYNRFARGQEQVLPQTPADEKGLLDFGPQGQSSGLRGKQAPSRKLLE